jgi:hypothetical protein
MQTLTLFTQAHRRELHIFTSPIVERSARETAAFLCVAYPWKALDISALTSFLERVAVYRHPVYSRSPRLAELALNRAEVHEANVRKLSEYLDTHTSLNIEGYITFRMAEYHYKLDIIMYGIIKKLKLI